MVKNILYWRGILNRPRVEEILGANIEVLEQLLRGELTHGLFPKKMAGKGKEYQIYSVRLDAVGRILFTSTDDKKIAVLDVVLDHGEDYINSKYMRNPELVKLCIEKNRFQEKATATADDAEQATSSLQDDNFESTTFDIFGDKIIILNPEQEKVISTTLPAIVVGPAGSGKTSTAFSILIQKCIEDEDNPERFLYVSPSKNLIEKLKEEWEQLTQEEQGNLTAEEWSKLTQKESFHKYRNKVHFKSYAELVKAVTDKDIIEDEKEFTGWYATWSKKKPNKSQLEVLNRIHEEERIKTIWKEMRIRSGYEEAEYLGLGKKRTTDKNIQPAIISIYNAYLGYLNVENKFSLCLNKLPDDAFTDQYKLVIVDETQSLSYGQCARLQQIAAQRNSLGEIIHNIIYLVGHHQARQDEHSHIEYLKQMLPNHSYTELPFNYRCAMAPSALATLIVKIKNAVVGGVIDASEVSEIKSFNSKIGHATLINTQEESQKTIEEIKGNNRVDIAVATDIKFIEEAKVIFGQNLVDEIFYTPDNVIGLEFRKVYLWRADEWEGAKKAEMKFNPISASFNSEASCKVNRPKEEEKDTGSVSYFNGLIVSITRSTEDVVIIQTKSGKKPNKIFAEIEKFCKINPSRAESYEPMAASREEDYIEWAHTLLKKGFTERGRITLFNHIPLEQAEALWAKWNHTVVTPVLTTADSREITLTKQELDKKVEDLVRAGNTEEAAKVCREHLGFSDDESITTIIKNIQARIQPSITASATTTAEGMIEQKQAVTEHETTNVQGYQSDENQSKDKKKRKKRKKPSNKLGDQPSEASSENFNLTVLFAEFLLDPDLTYKHLEKILKHTSSHEIITYIFAELTRSQKFIEIIAGNGQLVKLFINFLKPKPTLQASNPALKDFYKIAHKYDKFLSNKMNLISTILTSSQPQVPDKKDIVKLIGLGVAKILTRNISLLDLLKNPQSREKLLPYILKEFTYRDEDNQQNNPLFMIIQEMLLNNNGQLVHNLKTYQKILEEFIILEENNQRLIEIFTQNRCENKLRVFTDFIIYFPQVTATIFKKATKNAELLNQIIKLLSAVTQDNMILHLIAAHSEPFMLMLIELAHNNETLRNEIIRLLPAVTKTNWTSLHYIARYSPKAMVKLIALTKEYPVIFENIIKLLPKKTDDNWNCLHLISLNSPEILVDLINLAEEHDQFNQIIDILPAAIKDNWNGLQLIALHSSKAMVQLIEIAATKGRLTSIIDLLPAATNNNVNGLQCIAQYSPEALEKLLDLELIDLAEDHGKFSQILDLLPAAPRDTWNSLFLIAEFSPESLVKLIDVAEKRGQFDKIIDLLPVTTKNNWNSLHIFARFSPEVMEKLLNVAESNHNLREAIKENLIKQNNDGWSPIHAIAYYYPQNLNSFFTFASKFPDIEQQLFNSLSLQIKKYNNVEVTKDIPTTVRGFIEVYGKEDKIEVLQVIAALQKKYQTSDVANPLNSLGFFPLPNYNNFETTSAAKQSVDVMNLN